MKKWPKINTSGELPSGIHKASLSDVIEHFGKGNFQRAILAQRLHRIYDRAVETGQTARFIIFGFFVTDKPKPQDLDIFLLMEDTFDIRQVAEKIPENYHLSASGFLAELDRMNLEVREYLWSHPSKFSEDRRTA